MKCPKCFEGFNYEQSEVGQKYLKFRCQWCNGTMNGPDDDDSFDGDLDDPEATDVVPLPVDEPQPAEPITR